MQDWLKFHDLGQAFCYLVVVKHKHLSVPARFGLNILGFGLFGAGVIGILVPGMPTTIFWILAALVFYRSHPRMLGRILHHRRFGPGIKLLMRHRAISRRGRVVSIAAMCSMSGLSIMLVPVTPVRIAIAVGAALGVVSVLCLRSAEKLPAYSGRI